MHKLTRSLATFSLALLLITPLFYTTQTANYFSTPKLLLLGLVLMLSLAAWALPLVRREVRFATHPATIPALLIVIAMSVNLLFRSEARFEALVTRAAPYMLGAFIVLFLPTSLHMTEKTKELASRLFLGMTSLLALHSLLQLTFLHKLTTLPTYLQSQFFTPTGGLLTTLSLLLLGGIFLAGYLRQNQHPTALYGTLLALHTIALVAYLAILVPGNFAKLDVLPWSASWSLALDALKRGSNLILGVGLGNYGVLYSAAKPLFLNSTAYWNVVVQNGNPELLHLLATTGLLGTGALALLGTTAATHGLKSTTRPFALLPLATGTLLLLTPFNVSLWTVFVALLVVSLPTTEHTHTIEAPLSWSLLALTLLAIGSLGFVSYRLTRAEVAMRSAQRALGANDGKAIYDLHIDAINSLPWNTEYHLSYAQVNLTLASAISAKKDLTDSDRTTITQLVSQAIREGKTAVALRPSDSRSWQYLGLTYRNLINVAQGADQFALDAYAQAVSLDPANPALRFDFASLLAQLAQTEKDETKQSAYYARAVSEYQTAIQLKADYANAYYNLSKVLEMTKNYESAAAMLDKTISLLPDGNDKQTAQSEFETLKAKLPKPSATPAASPEPSVKPASSDLSEPTPLPSPLPGGPVALPKDN
jgi:tetratricopeptide (TPR) repeat protein